MKAYLKLLFSDRSCAKVTASAAIGLLLVSFSACQLGLREAEDPKTRLQEYVSQSFSIQKAEDRTRLMGHLTGEAKTRFAAWSEEQFNQAFLQGKRQFLKLLIRETKRLSPEHVQITYELIYLDQAKGKDAKVTQKKLCDLLLQQGQWKISDVKSIKELVEYQNELVFP